METYSYNNNNNTIFWTGWILSCNNCQRRPTKTFQDFPTRTNKLRNKKAKKKMFFSLFHTGLILHSKFLSKHSDNVIWDLCLFCKVFSRKRTKQNKMSFKWDLDANSFHLSSDIHQILTNGENILYDSLTERA